MVQIKINPPVESRPCESGTPDLELVRVNLPKIPFPVYASPHARIREVWIMALSLEPSDFWRHAAIIHPITGRVYRAGRKFTELDPVAGLKNGVEI